MNSARFWVPRHGYFQPVQGGHPVHGRRFYGVPLVMAGGVLTVVVMWAADYNPAALLWREIHVLAREVGGSARPAPRPAVFAAGVPDPEGAVDRPTRLESPVSGNRAPPEAAWPSILAPEAHRRGGGESTRLAGGLL